MLKKLEATICQMEENRSINRFLNTCPL